MPALNPSTAPPRDIIDREAEAIWHITELLSKLGAPGKNGADSDSEVTLTCATLHHFARQISHRLNILMESVSLHEDELGIKN